jgi:hypothetical protein
MFVSVKDTQSKQSERFEIPTIGMGKAYLAGSFNIKEAAENIN